MMGLMYLGPILVEFQRKIWSSSAHRARRAKRTRWRHVGDKAPQSTQCKSHRKGVCYGSRSQWTSRRCRRVKTQWFPCWSWAKGGSPSSPKSIPMSSSNSNFNNTSSRKARAICEISHCKTQMCSTSPRVKDWLWICPPPKIRSASPSRETITWSSWLTSRSKARSTLKTNRRYSNIKLNRV